jgi:lipopolysaccharide transport system ATP-binding protein
MKSDQRLAIGDQLQTQHEAGESILRVSGLRKEFRFYHHPWDRALEWITGGYLQRSQVFTALHEVTFEIAKGAALGIIGANGAGKSTLLKIICGTLYPTAGRVELAGRVASLLELGTGFHPDFSGRQNIVFNARFLGLSDVEIHERMTAIVAFSELGEFIDRPLRTYSSGMYLRLAFAVVANVEPQLLVIDEALAVGDAYFQQKCMRRIRQFRDDGVTLLFVSHDPGAVKTLCSEALLLHQGRLIERGRPDEVLESYNTLIAREAGSREILSLEREQGAGATTAARRSGSFLAVVEQVRLCDARGEACRSFIAGEEATITVRILCLDDVTEPTIGILIRDRLGNDIYGTNTYHQQMVTGGYRPGEVLEVSFRLALNLGPGEYTLTVAVHTLDVHIHDSFDWIDRLLVFKVLPPLTGKFIGTTFLQPCVAHHREDRPYRPEDWCRVLAHVFGHTFPRDLTMTHDGKPWLFSGWYPVEGQGESAFCWTSPTFAFLIDLRGEHLHVELGTDNPTAETTPLRVAAWVFAHSLGELAVQRAENWSVCSLPIPEAYRIPHGFVRVQVEGWCPAEVGLNADQRILGVRVRRLWVANHSAGG